jgi:hypothetical protein
MAMVQFDRPIVEVYPESMVSGGEPGLIEQAYGLIEKTGERVKLPAIFPLREKAVIYTYSWLAPVVYRFEPERGVIVVHDVYPPSPSASYIVESVGGERIRKQTIAGVVYVNTRPYSFQIGYEYTGLTQEKLQASLILEEVEVQVSDATKLLLELWRRHGALDASRIAEDVRRLFRRIARQLIAEAGIEDVLKNTAALEERVREEVDRLLGGYGLKLSWLEVTPKVPPNVYEYYFWHIVNELPAEYSFIIHLLNRIPDDVKKNVPLAVEDIVKSILEMAERRHR